MVGVWVIVFIYIIIISVDMSILLKYRSIKGIVFSTVIYIISLTLTILIILDIKVPSPSKAIEDIVKGVMKYI
ncbi:hypothetical protein GOM49_11525 [Clostridium bovifaecis]|uniref:Uncharacterized protein n=1 Tax=Clostridium bovifaecis TaxID=2184719 RepID=A0A6I6EPJ1_9CLOT|nr:hypothetical protein GOM49_11525 [Clostridium bovifaecis]